jgi:hypothetical protein
LNQGARFLLVPAGQLCDRGRPQGTFEMTVQIDHTGESNWWRGRVVKVWLAAWADRLVARACQLGVIAITVLVPLPLAPRSHVTAR